MNEISNNLISWMEHLQALMPASHLTLIGAGTGKGTWVQWLKACEVSCTVVEGEPLQFAALQRLCAASNALENAILINQFVAPTSAEVEVFTANLAQEGGLLEPEVLRPLWPNLYTRQREKVQAIGLASLLNNRSSGQFLILDCLPAATLLQSVRENLSLLDVVVARVLMAEDYGPIDLPQGTSFPEVAQSLPGFSLQYVHREVHPGIAYAIFSRDYRGELKKSEQVKHQLMQDVALSRESTAELLKKNEREAQANNRLEINLAEAHHKLELEFQATQSALNALQQLREDVLDARQVEAELLQKIDHQLDIQRELEASLKQSQQEVAAERDARRAFAEEQQQLKKVAQELAQKAEAELRQTIDQQAKTQKALEASLKQSQQEVVFVRDARNAATEQLQQLKVAQELAQKVEVELRQTIDQQAKTQKTLEASLKQSQQEVAAERDARRASAEEQQQLKVAQELAQKAEAELRQTIDQQAKTQKALEASLKQSQQEVAVERDVHNAATAEQLQQLKVAQELAQKVEAELRQTIDQQAKTQKVLEASLKQSQQEVAAERDAHNAATEQQQQLKTELLKAQKVQAELVQKSNQQVNAQNELEAKLTRARQEQERVDNALNAAIDEQQKIKVELQKTRKVLENTENLAAQRLVQLSAFELRISQLQALVATQSSNKKQLADSLSNTTVQLDILKSLIPAEIFRSDVDRDSSVLGFRDQPSGHRPNKIEVEQIACIELGDGWAGNTVNTVIFRHHGILTKDEYQYTAFYVDESTLRVVQRHLGRDSLHIHDIRGQFNLKDAHNSISLGVDRDGCLHMSYDHHATRLRYRRSLNSHDIDSWTDELPMTGAYEDRVTYPTFILPRHEFPLTMLYRDGSHNKGSARIKIYDEEERSWKDHPIAILSGADNKPWTSNAYWNHPAIGTDGSLHLSFVWRTEMLGEKQLINNVNIGYAWSPDNGVSWFTSLGKPCKLPMTQANAETVWPVSPGSNLINQCSMTLDSKNRPHIAYYSNDIHGVPQYQHLWFDGVQWCCTQVSEREQCFDLKGGGTLQIPISRPEIVVDENDHVIVIFRGDMTGDYLAFSMLEMKWGKYQVTISDEVLWPEFIEFSEPVIDRERWKRERILSCLIQRTAQPDGDRSHELKSSDLKIVDILFN